MALSLCVLGLSRLSRVPDVLFKACVAAGGWPCSRDVLLALPFLSLHLNGIAPSSLVSQGVLCRCFSPVKLHRSQPQPLSFEGSEEVANPGQPLTCLRTQR